MKRRRFILLSVAGTVAAGIPLSHCGIGNHAYQPDFLISTIGKTRAKDIGKIYLEQFPSEADRKKLQEFISGSSDKQSESDVNLTIQNEFRSGKIIIINGWVLSVTEARQSALLFLNS